MIFWKRKKICLHVGTENNVLKRISWLEYSCEAGSYFPYSIVFLIDWHFIGTVPGKCYIKLNIDMHIFKNYFNIPKIF